MPEPAPLQRLNLALRQWLSPCQTNSLDINPLRPLLEREVNFGLLCMHRIAGGALLAPFGADSETCADMAFVRKLFERGRAAGQEWLQAHRTDVGVRTTIKIADNA